MAAPAYPCAEWVSLPEIRQCGCTDPAEVPDLELARARRAATELLYELSHRRFPAFCQMEYRPAGRDACCQPQCVDPCSRQGCGCAPAVRLPEAPAFIVEVTVDGVVIPSEGYRVEGDQLIRQVTAGENPGWPVCQRMDLPASEATFTVTYGSGMLPPQLAKDAVAALACQIALACAGSSACTLPEGTQRVTRQGVTIERSAVGDLGLPEVTRFLEAYGDRPASPSRVWWPGRTDSGCF